MPRTSEEIKNEVVYRISGDIRIDPSRIKVEISDGQVDLSGSVHSISAREAAESDAWAVKEVSKVKNRLAIRFPKDYSVPSDDAIRESLSKLFSTDPDLYLEKIESSVQNGNVSLDGTVDNFYKKLHAEQMTRNTGGVVEVHNKIAVVPSRDISDELIGRNLAHKLHRSAVADGNPITVEVNKGHVVLTGTVSNRSVFDAAEDIVRYTEGVVNFENRILIRS
jgi:osmotically-inducible protein OsmY